MDPSLNPQETAYSVREAVASFASDAALQDAILALQEAGVDRARLSVLARDVRSDGSITKQSWMHHLTDLPHVPNGSPIDDASLAEERAGIIAIPAYGGAMVGLIAVVGSGGALAAAIGAAAAGAAIAGGIGALFASTVAKHHHEHIAKQIAAGGFVLWVQVRGDDDAVLKQLMALNGEHVHVIDAEQDWGTQDIPFAQSQPDPFLEG